jgi:NADPH:quinone reductase-like Zn-dependent oxidoreductase
MRAAVIYGHGGEGSIKYEPSFPDPRPGPGEVLLKVKAATLNYHDVFTRRGMPGIRIQMPAIMGIDFAGEIAELGSGVEGWEVGQAVMVDPFDRVNFALYGEMRPGGFAELCCVGAHMLIPLPKGFSFEMAAALPAAYGTAHRMMYERAHVKAGEKVLILGASGGVGTGAVQLAKIAGCHVVACAGTDEKAARLKALGADTVINYQSENFVGAINKKYGKPLRWSDQYGMDVVINFTGGDTWVPSLRTLRKQGRLITCGATAGFGPKEDIRYIWSYELEIRGSNGWGREDLTALVDLVHKGALVPVLEERKFSLETVNEAFAFLEERRAYGKVLVVP